MREDTCKTALCLAVLNDGPATTAEVCAETGLTSKSAGSLLATAFLKRRVLKRWFKKFHDLEDAGYSDVVLWVLPEHASAWPDAMEATNA